MSTFTRYIALQFLINRLSLSFFSMRVIIASFCGVDSIKVVYDLTSK